MTTTRRDIIEALAYAKGEGSSTFDDVVDACLEGYPRPSTALAIGELIRWRWGIILAPNVSCPEA